MHARFPYTVYITCILYMDAKLLMKRQEWSWATYGENGDLHPLSTQRETFRMVAW